MNKFESFSVDDIRKLRDEESEKLKDMTSTEVTEYFTKGAERAKKRIKELRKTKVAI